MKSQVEVDLILRGEKPIVTLADVVTSDVCITHVETDLTSLAVGYTTTKFVPTDTDVNFCNGDARRGGYSGRALSERTLELLIQAGSVVSVMDPGRVTVNDSGQKFNTYGLSAAAEIGRAHV